MTADELRADPWAWTFARQHRQMQPVLARSRRRRRGLQMLVGAALVAGLTFFGSSMLSAGPPAAVGVNDAGAGGYEITVQSEAGADDIVADLRAAFDKRGVGVRVETVSGRELVIGRVIGDGPGVAMVDSDPAMDYTATRVLIAHGAVGVVSVVVHGGGTPALYVSDMNCSTFGRSLAEVHGELLARGFEVVVVPVVLDENNNDRAFAVASAELATDRAALIVQPTNEIESERADCR